MLIELAQRMHALSDAELVGCVLVLGVLSPRAAGLLLGILAVWQLENIATLLGGLK